MTSEHLSNGPLAQVLRWLSTSALLPHSQCTTLLSDTSGKCLLSCRSASFYPLQPRHLRKRLFRCNVRVTICSLNPFFLSLFFSQSILYARIFCTSDYFAYQIVLGVRLFCLTECSVHQSICTLDYSVLYVILCIRVCYDHFT